MPLLDQQTPRRAVFRQSRRTREIRAFSVLPSFP